MKKNNMLVSFKTDWLVSNLIFIENNWAAELPNCCQYQKISEKAPVFTGHQSQLPALDPIILQKSWQWTGLGRAPK